MTVAGKRLTGERAFRRLVAMFSIAIAAQLVLIFATDIPLDTLKVWGMVESFTILAYGFVMVWQIERQKG